MAQVKRVLFVGLSLAWTAALCGGGDGGGGGCNFTIDIGSLELAAQQIDRAINAIQTEDPRDFTPPDDLHDRGDTIIIDTDVTVVVNVEQQITVREAPRVTLLGFENLTGADIYIRYEADGEFQGIFIFDGETLLLEYPCLDDVALLSEDDFDPDTGVFIDSFDLRDIVFLNGPDFGCGEAFIISIDASSVLGSTEAIDLVQ